MLYNLAYFWKTVQFDSRIVLFLDLIASYEIGNIIPGREFFQHRQGVFAGTQPARITHKRGV